MDKLLGLLQENARLSCDQLAVMLGTTPEEVEKQIAAYEKAGVIRGYHTLINWEKADANHASALIELLSLIHICSREPKGRHACSPLRCRPSSDGTATAESRRADKRRSCPVCGRVRFVPP